MKTILSLSWGIVFLLIAAGRSPAQPDGPANLSEPIDYLTFARGAVPLSISASDVKQPPQFTQAMRIIDGNPKGFVLVNGASSDTVIEIVYELPAPTTFDRFAVPNVLETPSPSQTFVHRIDVLGSAAAADGEYVPLASATLATHAARGRTTDLDIIARVPVRWVKLRLRGGIQMAPANTSLEISEIIGNGTQEMAPLADDFTGSWRAKGVAIELKQDGPLVSGCYDESGELNGAVIANLVYATGVDRGDKVASTFILNVTPDGSLRGVRSTNGAPFNLYAAPRAPAGGKPICPAPPSSKIGCGSILHGIRFAFDSAEIQPESDPVLARLYAGLNKDATSSIVIEGHTSSEGSDDYNQKLSERRAQAVVEDLIRRGLAADRIRALGVGEKRPIATNEDESGRSLNRRVEVHCGQP